jgi:hypothetical protein
MLSNCSIQTILALHAQLQASRATMAEQSVVDGVV